MKAARAMDGQSLASEHGARAVNPFCAHQSVALASPDGVVDPTASTVFVLDDDAAMLRSLTRTLRTAGYGVQCYAHPRAFLARVNEDCPGCLVLDLQLPEMSGIELQAALTTREHSLPIVFISGHGDIPTAVRTMKAGAVDFLAKPVHARELLDAVAAALSRDRAARINQASQSAARRRYGLLSPQEERVCQLVARGLLNKQIASELGLAEQTVRVYRGRTMHKLGVGSVAELMQLLARIDRA